MAATIGTSPLVIDMLERAISKDKTYPLTIVLNTVDAGKKIELSVDGGNLYFTPVYNTSHANQLVASVTSPITHIKLTGDGADTWLIL